MKYRVFLIFLIIVLIQPQVFAESTLEFTEEELAFIEEHPTITLGIDPAFVPFEFIDTDGNYKGIANEYIKILSERIGIEMNIVEDLTWSEAYIGAVEKNIDVLPCVSRTDEREKYFLFSTPYYQFQRVIVMNDSKLGFNNLEDFYGHTVAVQKNSSHDGFLNDYPRVQKSYYHSAESGLLAVANGTEDFFVGNLAVTNHLIGSLGITGIKYIPIEKSDINTLHFAVRNDWPELQSIINKGLASITSEEKMQINNQWISIKEAKDYSEIFQILIIIGSIIALAILVSIYWITQLRKEIKKRIIIEEDLMEAKKEADLANDVKSNFLARMSHEIRTPLNAITGLSYILGGTQLEDIQRSHVDKIKQASNMMLSIINDILDFSKIEAGKVDIESVSFELDQVIKNILNIISFRIEEKNLDFTFTKEPNIPNCLIGDKKRIGQVLLNIITNAIKFTEKGAIALKVNLIGFKRNIYQIEFVISDTGIGMSDNHLNHLFEPFTQEDASINRRFGGTGLGLSIVKNLVELMGGDLTVSSNLDQGSEFVVTLELASDLERNKTIQKGIEYIRDIKTLILDKDIKSTNLINEYLSVFGIESEFTSSPDQCIKMLESTTEKMVKPYDLLIIDYKSIKNYTLFIESIQNNKAIETMPKIIAIFPFMEEKHFDKLTGKSVGLVKPIFPSILYNSIADLFKYKVIASHIEDDHDSMESFTGFDKHLVLIVEDNMTNQFIAQSLLEKIGIESMIANNGQEGVDLYKKHDFDLVLMDLHMPVLNGFEATEQIRKLNTSIPIIAMTADAVEGVVEKCKASGLNHFISKPFDPDEFVKSIMRILKDETKDAEIILNTRLGLKLIGGNEALYKQVITIFIEENKSTSLQAEELITAKNYNAAVQLVHKVKSSAGSVGSDKVHKLASQLQTALEEANDTEIIHLKNEFVKHLDLLIEALKQY